MTKKKTQSSMQIIHSNDKAFMATNVNAAPFDIHVSAGNCTPAFLSKHAANISMP